MNPVPPVEISPADRRRAKVRGAILKAADQAFASKGEEGLSIRGLAEAIDYSPAAIYKYFGSKEELIDALKEAFFERLLQRIDESRKGDAPFHERVRKCVKVYVDTALERPHHYAAAFSGVLDPPVEASACEDSDTEWADFSVTNKGNAFGQLVEMMEEGQAHGVFDPDLSPWLAAKTVWAASHGVAQLMTHMPDFHSMRPGGEALTADAFISFYTNIILRGLQGPDPRYSLDIQ